MNAKATDTLLRTAPIDGAEAAKGVTAFSTAKRHRTVVSHAAYPEVGLAIATGATATMIGAHREMTVLSTTTRAINGIEANPEIDSHRATGISKIETRSIAVNPATAIPQDQTIGGVTNQAPQTMANPTRSQKTKVLV